MEPASKRQRFSNQITPNSDLKSRRAKNDSRLKSIFESIFDKYSKDFDGIGDEIDLRTGEIVVDNGHLLGIRNEIDTGQTSSLSGIDEGIALSDDNTRGEGELEDQQDLDESATILDASAGPNYESTLQALYIVDSLVEDAGKDDSSASFGRSLQGQIMDYNSEEDELADKTVEWVTPREARAIASEKWQLPQSGPQFVDEIDVEEAWRVPPLPNTPSDDQQGPPVRTPLQKLRQGPERRKSLEEPITHPSQAAYQAMSIVVPELPKDVDGELMWSCEEEDRLQRLKKTTKLGYTEMERLFPGRHKTSIASKWTRMRNRDNICNERVQRKRKRILPSPSTSGNNSPTSEGSNDRCRVDHDEISQDKAAIFDTEDWKTAGMPQNTVPCGPESLESAVIGTHMPSDRRPVRASKEINLSSNQKLTPGQSIMVPQDRDHYSNATSKIQDRLLREGEQLKKTQCFKNDAGRRRKRRIKTLDADCGGVIETGFRPPVHGGTNASPTNDRGPGTLDHGIPRSSPSQRQSQGPTLLVNTNGYGIFKETLTWNKQSRLAHNSPSSSDRQAKQAVRVIVPLRQTNKIIEVTTRSKIGERERLDQDSVSEAEYIRDKTIRIDSLDSGIDYDGPGQAFDEQGKFRPIKIPDSQSEPSSPIEEGKEAAQNATPDEKPGSKVSNMASAVARQTKLQANIDANYVEEFVDELSIPSDTPKKRQGFRSPRTFVNSPTLSTSRREMKLAHRVGRTTLANSFSSHALDVQDCSEDELSFM